MQNKFFSSSVRSNIDFEMNAAAAASAVCNSSDSETDLEDLSDIFDGRINNSFSVIIMILKYKEAVVNPVMKSSILIDPRVMILIIVVSVSIYCTERIDKCTE